MPQYDQPIVCEPTGDVSASVIWLHGLGADGNDFVPIVPHLRSVVAHTRFIFPNAPMIPVSVNQGFVMRAWYDIDQRNGEFVSDEDGIVESSAYLAGLVEAEHDNGVDYGRIVVAGFSQGGAIAQHAGLRHRHRLAGLMALSTYLPMPEKLSEQAHTANRDLPIFLAHGDYDPMIPIARAEQSRDVLLGLDYAVRWHHYAMDHSVCQEEIDDIDAWLAEVIGLG